MRPNSESEKSDSENQRNRDNNRGFISQLQDIMFFGVPITQSPATTMVPEKKSFLSPQERNQIQQYALSDVVETFDQFKRRTETRKPLTITIIREKFQRPKAFKPTMKLRSRKSQPVREVIDLVSDESVVEEMPIDQHSQTELIPEFVQDQTEQIEEEQQEGLRGWMRDREQQRQIRERRRRKDSSSSNDSESKSNKAIRKNRTQNTKKSKK